MEVRDLTFSYEGREPWLIENLDLKVEKGMFLTVLGENGSAKSTLIRILLGLLRPSKGSVTSQFTNIGYVPQKKETFNMSFPITVEELLDIHINTLRYSSMTVKEALDKVGLYELRKRLFGSLSGGQQQRVLIARALSSNPDLLILDEPLTGIDSQSQEILRKILIDLNSKGLTIVSIEHDIAFALHNSSHILTMKEGRGTLYTTEEFLSRISHEDMDNYLYHKEEHHHHV